MLLLYFMDGVKYDMMKKHMPFLASLHTKPLISELGYSCACHATMYTSRYIDEHKTWFIWKRGDHSPYRWLNFVPGLKYLNFLPLKLVIGKLARLLNRNSSYPGVPWLVNLPLKYWPYFETCDTVMWDDPAWKKEIPNMFTILKKHKIPFQTVALHRGTRADDVFREEASVDYKKNEVVYYFIGYTDNIMHTYGEHAQEAQKYFRKVDAFIKKTYEKAKKEHDDVTVIAFSDHGHIGIREPKIDIDDYFRPKGLKVNSFLHLIESNYARFWFRDDRERQAVRTVLKEMEEKGLGFVLTKQHLDQYHLRVNPKEHGELIFYLAAPHEFTKTIWGFGHTVRSGHGFEPTLPDHYGIFCSNLPLEKDREFAYLVDVLPSVMAQTGISQEGYTLRGQNIVKIGEEAGSDRERSLHQ